MGAEQPPPYNSEAERNLLGAILLNNDVLCAVIGKVKPEDFFVPQHRRIFQHMVILAQGHKPIDLVTLIEQSNVFGELEAAGGAAYLSQLADGMPRVNNIEHYARMIKEKAALRSLAHIGTAIEQGALERGAQPGEVIAQALALIQSIEHASSPGIRASEVKCERVSWLWRGRIPLKKITMVDGDPGLGKSAMILDLAARITSGRPMPDGTTGVSGGAVIISSEDSLGDTVRPRLEAAGADLRRVLCIGPDQSPPMIPSDLSRIEMAVRDMGAMLLVFDPLMAFLPAQTNSWRDQDIRRALAPLGRMAERAGVAVLLVRHLNKRSGGNPLYRGGGSIGIIGAARSGLLVARDPDDETSRVLACVKSNLAPSAPSLRFRLQTVEGGVLRLLWSGQSTCSAADLLAEPATTVEERGAVEPARSFLVDLLSKGAVSVKEIRRQAHEAGISDRTLDRAKSLAKVGAHREGGIAGSGRWFWSLQSEGDATTPKSVTSSDLAFIGQSPKENLFSSGISSMNAGSGNLADLRGDLPALGEIEALKSESQFEQCGPDEPKTQPPAREDEMLSKLAPKLEQYQGCIACLSTAEQARNRVKMCSAMSQRFGQAHASLFPLIGHQVMTPKGLGRLEQVFHDRISVALASGEHSSFFRLEEIVVEAHACTNELEKGTKAHDVI